MMTESDSSQDKVEATFALLAAAKKLESESDYWRATEKFVEAHHLLKILADEETAKAVQAAAKTSMGMECSAVDMVNIINFTQRMVKLAEFRKNLSNYLTEKMGVVAPNLSALIGDTVAARLISKVGNDEIENCLPQQ